MPHVTVRLFAGLRERAGTGSTALELPAGAVAGDVWALLDLGEQPPGIAFAINRTYADASTPVDEGDEIALIPPVSGGSDEPRIGVAISADPIDIAAAHARANDERAGAQAAFTGTVRNATRGKDVVRLEYEAYAEMAERVMDAIVGEAEALHPGARVAIRHRLGVLGVGELAVVIAAEALGVGLGTAAFVAFIARTTNPLYTATQLALFTSLMAVPRTFVNASTGYLVERVGWFAFFVLCTALAVPGMLLLFKVAPWGSHDEDERASPSAAGRA